MPRNREDFDDQFVDQNVYALLQCARDLQIAAFAMMPRLIDDLNGEAQRYIETAADARGFAEKIEESDDGDGAKEK